MIYPIRLDITCCYTFYLSSNLRNLHNFHVYFEGYKVQVICFSVVTLEYRKLEYRFYSGNLENREINALSRESSSPGAT